MNGLLHSPQLHFRSERVPNVQTCQWDAVKVPLNPNTFSSRVTEMNTIFGANTTTDELLDGIDVRNKRVLVTGVSAGLGLETARALASHGAQVIGTARNVAKAKAAIAASRKATRREGGNLSVVELDLANLASVRSGSDLLLEQGTPLDVIIANAGVMATPFGRTVDGFETQFATNHLGHFVLVNRVRKLLRSPGRLVNVSSAGHRFSNVDLVDTNFEKTPYDPFVAYGRSKTANILFAVAFDLRHREAGLRACAVHPGGVSTELERNLDPVQVQARVKRINEDLVSEGKAPFTYKTVAQGAATSIWAAVVASPEEIGGRYCENCHVSQIVPADQLINVNSEGVRAYAMDPKAADNLWKKSEELVGEHF